MKLSVALLISLASSATFAEGTALSVPSDAKAIYYVLEKSTKGTVRTIVTKRAGSSGESFSKREVDCKNDLIRYIGTGDTIAEMKASRPNEKLSPIVPGSIAYYIGKAACA
ncbi:hypothetical protein [Variovorax sp. ZT4R33]|uniref:hypothetical protein n=1 Tax=Variovorax sp. ZT4R33 TaxID=3443743 RepID=UPI003F44C1F5